MLIKPSNAETMLVNRTTARQKEVEGTSFGRIAQGAGSVFLPPWKSGVVTP